MNLVSVSFPSFMGRGLSKPFKNNPIHAHALFHRVDKTRVQQIFQEKKFQELYEHSHEKVMTDVQAGVICPHSILEDALYFHVFSHPCPLQDMPSIVQNNFGEARFHGCLNAIVENANEHGYLVKGKQLGEKPLPVHYGCNIDKELFYEYINGIGTPMDLSDLTRVVLYRSWHREDGL